jgi:hypothetical protein
MKAALVICLVLVARAAHADEDPCQPAPAADPTLRKLAVAADKQKVLITAPGSLFPAISEDGATVVQFFDDARDFSDEPIPSVVFWSSDGRQLLRTQSADAANARLAKTRWRAIPFTDACVVGDRHEPTGFDAIFVDGIRLHYDVATSELAVLGGHPAHRHVKLPMIGKRISDPPGSCGYLRAMIVYWVPSARLAILIPGGGLGGDSCMGQPSAELATPVSLH